jgi:hypothetical protein
MNKPLPHLSKLPCYQGEWPVEALFDEILVRCMDCSTCGLTPELSRAAKRLRLE